MSYYRFPVPGGEFVIQGGHSWQITFNGIQIGGHFDAPEDALRAVERRRAALVPGPDLSGVPTPPTDLRSWSTKYVA